MFSESKKRQTTDSFSTQNLIAKGTKIVGDLQSEGDIRIDGDIQGNIISSGKVVIGKTGQIEGTLTSKDAYLEGKFSGTLQVSNQLTLKATAHLDGEVTLGTLAVEPGASFNATCVMKGAVKQMKNNDHKQSEEQSKTEKYA